MKRWSLPLVASFVLFLALCATLAYWALQFFAPAQRPVAAAPATVAVAPVDLSAAATLFGGRGNMAVASNFQLQGVVLSGNAQQSIAILSANGEPAQAVRMGSEVAPGVTVKEVHRGYVLLADGGAVKRVELPVEPDLLGSATAAPVATSATDASGAEAAAAARERSAQEQRAQQAAEHAQQQQEQQQPASRRSRQLQAPSQSASGDQQAPASAGPSQPGEDAATAPASSAMPVTVEPGA